MKLLVPLMMPAIQAMRLAVSPSRSALMIGNAAADGRFEGDHDAGLLCRGEDLVAVRCEQRLVGGHHVLAARDRLQHQRPRRLDAADELEHDVDIVPAHQGGPVRIHLDGVGRLQDRARLLRCARGDLRDADRAPGPARDLLGVALQNRPRAATDRAQPEHAHAHRLHREPSHYANPSSRNICLMPRMAWRVRGSFSIMAKRTCPSPNSPKPTPGDTDTLALASSFLVNSSEPSLR